MPQSQIPAIAAHGDRSNHKLAYIYAAECCHLYNSGAVTLYDLALTEVVRTITVPTPNFIVVDRSGRLYTVNQSYQPSVTEYDQGSEKPSRRIRLGGAWAAVTDSSNNLYVAVCTACLPYGSGNGSINVYGAGTTKLLRTITQGVNIPVSVAVDSVGNLYVANRSYADSSVTVYAPGSTKILRTLSRRLTNPTQLALDASNNLFVMNASLNSYGSVVEYQANSSEILRHITNGVLLPQAIAVDDSGNLFVANSPEFSSGWISVYAPGQSRPSYKIKIGVHKPVALTADDEGNLYVADNGPNRAPRYIGTVCVYAANTQTPMRCVRRERRFDQPSWLAIGP
ncbi:MAG TPA: hypothetical protein VGI19_11910 [Candidatus Cybelea sp.]